jgi:hypothetical protein
MCPPAELPDTNRIGAVLVAVFAYPGDHFLEIDQVIRVLRGRPQAVVRAVDQYGAA